MTRQGLSYARHVKRALDFAGSALLLGVTSPIYGACALAIRTTSGKPVHFHQVRVGQDGVPFRIHKFRTMIVDTERASGNYPTRAAVTPIGSFLRRTSLDELPQLINILRGEMSFVGPRPALPSQVDRYTSEQRRRLEVRPGLTGLAQVRHRNSATWSRRIITDLEYVTQLSPRLDLRIVLMTIPKALTGEGQIIGQSLADVDDLALHPDRDSGYEV